MLEWKLDERRFKIKITHQLLHDSVREHHLVVHWQAISCLVLNVVQLLLPIICSKLLQDPTHIIS